MPSETNRETSRETSRGDDSLEVTAIRDRWRVDDEWWRQPISRLYFQLVLDDGRCDTLYQDLLTEEWYRQNY